MVKKFALCGLCLTVALRVACADSTRVLFDSGFGGAPAVFDQNTGATNPLTGGTSANGDGAVLQLGYYDAATIGNNFAGTWIPLSGEMSLNTASISGTSPPEPYNKTSIGDITNNGAGTGSFALFLDFVSGSATSGNSLPSSPTIPLAFRFYNNTSIAGSTFYNVVSDDAWLWKTPATPQATMTISFDDSGLEWLSIFQGQAANTAFHTTISTTAVPEVSTVVCPLLAGAALVLHTLRRRIKS